MKGLFQAIVEEEKIFYFWTPILAFLSSPTYPPAPPSLPIHSNRYPAPPPLSLCRVLEHLCALSRFQHSGYLKCQDIYSAYVWQN